METIELKSGTVNPERIGALQADLKTNFYDVRAKYFRADLPKGEQTRPKNIFPAEPGNANYVILKVSRRDCLEFYKAAFKSHALFYKSNFSPEDAKRVLGSLQRTGFVKAPELPRVMVPQPVPQKSLIGSFVDSIKGILDKMQSLIRL